MTKKKSAPARKATPVSLQWKMESKIGPLYLVASDKGLSGVFWERKNIAMAKTLASTSPKTKALEHLIEAEKQLNEFFSGKRKIFDLALDPKGSEFQKQVWGELAKIPYGKTFSYRDLAKKLGREKAARAVGTANGRNPLCIIVPCHRVIAADGSLGGYSGGLEIKTKLLALEGGIK